MTKDELLKTKPIKKSTFSKKHTVEQIIDMILQLDPPRVAGNLPSKKTELVDILYELWAEKRKKPDGVDILQGRTLEFVFNEGILFRIDAHCWWGKSSKVAESELKIPKHIMGGVKNLVDENKLSLIKSLKSYGERVIKKRGYPFLGLKGVYYVPKAFIPGCENDLKNVQKRFYKQRSKFIEQLPEMKESWKVVSGEYYDESLYPTPEQMEKKFSFEWTKFIISLPDSNMALLSDDQLLEEAEKQRKNMVAFVEESLFQLSSKFISMLSRINDKTKGKEALGPKTVSSLRTFVEEFESWNFMKNPELSDLVKKASGLVSDLSAKEINQNEKVRAEINKQSDKIIKEFEKNAKTNPIFSRALDF